MKVLNEKGQIWYGLHFYPGVAEYQEPEKAPLRVFLNENTLREMDPTFAGRPVFVRHVDGVDTDVDELRKEADGWVIESFYNQADGKHWVKFITVSEKAERAIRQHGMRLSNCYIPKKYSAGGIWNGVSYAKEIVSGEYEHLAIVPDPRYDESIILTPEQFKQYNDDKLSELKRLANDNKKGDSGMKLNFFRRAKVENSIDLAEMSVELPKSKREVSIADLVKEADAAEEAKKAPRFANAADQVEVGSAKMSVGDLVAKHQAMCDELEAFKKKNVKEDDDHMENAEDDEDEEKKKKENEAKDDDKKENMEDEDAKAKALELAEHEEKEIKEAKQKNELEEERKRKAKEKADRLRNAQDKVEDESPRIDLSDDQVQRGKSRYGSN